MERDLFNRVVRVKSGNKDEIIFLIKRFKPLISKLSRNLNYECASSDLIIYFIELINNINLDKFNLKNDGALVVYISKSLRNKHFDILKKNSKYIDEVRLELNNFIDSKNNEEAIWIDEYILNNLSLKEIEYLNYKINYGYKDIEITKKLNLSRQSIYKMKCKIAKKIKNEYLEIRIERNNLWKMN